MKAERPAVSEEERLYSTLKGLYESFGYSRFRMRKFEEYSLYAENLNFLRSRDIITFAGKDGRLLALKPDVTLSIVKNCTGAGARKVYYRESVFRPDRPGGQFREISQIGLEFVGRTDDYARLEVLSLAAESLKAVGGDCVMELSHMGALEGIANSCGMTKLPEEVTACIRARNLHDMKSVCLSCGLGEGVAEKLCLLLSSGRGNGEKLSLLRTLFASDDRCVRAADELEGALNALGGDGKMFEVDFSLLNDPDYYNGFIFQGYVDKFPRAVLSGGQYDTLVKKFGAGEGGAGFALYPDDLDFYLGKRREFDADVLLLYPSGYSPAAVMAQVKKLTSGGESVYAAAEEPENMRFKRTVSL